MAKANANGQGTDNGNLKKEAWTALSVKMKAKHGFTPTSAQIKNQKTALQRIFLDDKFLRNQSSFGWDNDLAIVTADDDVWKELLEAHPRQEFGKMKDKPFPMYNLAYSVFNGKSATGDLAEQEMVPTTTQAVKLTATSKRKATKTNISNSGSDSKIEVEPASSAQTATTNTNKRVRMSKNTVIKREMEGINGAIHSVSQKANGLIDAFNMIALAISHNRQPTENTPALHSNPAVSPPGLIARTSRSDKFSDRLVRLVLVHGRPTSCRTRLSEQMVPPANCSDKPVRQGVGQPCPRTSWTSRSEELIRAVYLS
ncbi:hypothetical protein MJO29_010847 [Puccinia striiformis f. sp. tritici]|nr:hypothetical protein MJO29_010847 [Puccinia striiformis f. sp. tritici]